MPLPLISYTAQITPLLSLMENSLHRIKTKKITFKDLSRYPFLGTLPYHLTIFYKFQKLGRLSLNYFCISY